MTSHKRTKKLSNQPQSKNKAQTVRRKKTNNVKPIETTNPPQQSPLQKVVHTETVKKVKERIARIKEKITLPFKVETMSKGAVSKVKVINKEGKERQLLPDRPSRHVMLCHGPMAKVITSGMCVFSKITQHEEIDEQGNRTWIDGSWTIAPCHPAMLRGTTVQHVSRRKWFFLRRYWYEITFDGRVQPGAMFYDYDIDPAARSHTFYVSHEAVTVKGTDKENTFFRFWRHKPE